MLLSAAEHLHVVPSACAALQGHRGDGPRGQLWRKVSGLAALADQLAAAREAADPYAPAARDTPQGAAGPRAPSRVPADRTRPLATPPAAWGDMPQSEGPYADPYAPAWRTTPQDAAGASAPADRNRPREAAPPAAWGDAPQSARPYANSARADPLRGPALNLGGGLDMREGAGAHAPAPGHSLPLPGSANARRGHFAEQPEAWASGAAAPHSGRRAPATVAGWGGRAV